jgi:hypothetical protein
MATMPRPERGSARAHRGFSKSQNRQDHDHAILPRRASGARGRKGPNPPHKSGTFYDGGMSNPGVLGADEASEQAKQAVVDAVLQIAGLSFRACNTRVAGMNESNFGRYGMRAHFCRSVCVRRSATGYL